MEQIELLMQQIKEQDKKIEVLSADIAELKEILNKIYASIR